VISETLENILGASVASTRIRRAWKRDVDLSAIKASLSRGRKVYVMVAWLHSSECRVRKAL
jgi:hypothetical protein